MKKIILIEKIIWVTGANNDIAKTFVKIMTDTGCKFFQFSRDIESLRNYLQNEKINAGNMISIITLIVFIIAVRKNTIRGIIDFLSRSFGKKNKFKNLSQTAIVCIYGGRNETE
jgi:NADP-dependent 3-hydroxy acid dehydrogenase YdfG